MYFKDTGTALTLWSGATFISVTVMTILAVTSHTVFPCLFFSPPPSPRSLLGLPLPPLLFTVPLMALIYLPPRETSAMTVSQQFC